MARYPLPQEVKEQNTFANILEERSMTRPKTLSGLKAGQKTKELDQLVALLNEKEVRSYLEIGARHGDTWYHIVKNVPSIKYTVAVDLPGGAWGTETSADYLKRAADALRQLPDRDLSIEVIFGSSQEDKIQEQILHLLPSYDAVLIDGDHRYEGVRRDFELYAPHARKLVAFHDIAGEGVHQRSAGYPVEVPRLWREIIESKDAPFYENFNHYREFITDEEPENPMGIGVLVL